MTIINIAVVGDGPIGNLVISKLLIEHYNNNKKDSSKDNRKVIQIAHHTSNRFKKKWLYKKTYIIYYS